MEVADFDKPARPKPGVVEVEAREGCAEDASLDGRRVSGARGMSCVQAVNVGPAKDERDGRTSEGLGTLCVNSPSSSPSAIPSAMLELSGARPTLRPVAEESDDFQSVPCVADSVRLRVDMDVPGRETDDKGCGGGGRAVRSVEELAGDPPKE